MKMSDAADTSRRLLLVAAAALYDSSGRVLICQRPDHKQLGGLWEFPGGKVEHNEAPEHALVRELKEELDLTVAPDALDPYAFASHAYPDFHLLMPLYVVTHWQGAVKLDPNAAQAMKWVRPTELRTHAMPPADIVLVERLIERSAA